MFAKGAKIVITGQKARGSHQDMEVETMVKGPNMVPLDGGFYCAYAVAVAFTQGAVTGMEIGGSLGDLVDSDIGR